MRATHEANPKGIASFKVNPEVWRWFKAEAKRERVSTSELVRRAMQAFQIKRINSALKKGLTSKVG